MRTIYAAALVLCLGACTNATPKARKLMLDDAITTFHDKIRWRRCAGAANYVAPAYRSEFLDNCENMAERLGIQETRIRSAIIAAEKHTAEVKVRVHYYLLPSSVVGKHIATLKWKLEGEQWLVTHAQGAFFKELWDMEEKPEPAPAKAKPQPTGARTYPLNPQSGQ